MRAFACVRMCCACQISQRPYTHTQQQQKCAKTERQWTVRKQQRHCCHLARCVNKSNDAIESIRRGSRWERLYFSRCHEIEIDMQEVGFFIIISLLCAGSHAHNRHTRNWTAMNVCACGMA
jgi:hypothetical protein